MYSSDPHKTGGRFFAAITSDSGADVEFVSDFLGIKQKHFFIQRLKEADPSEDIFDMAIYVEKIEFMGLPFVVIEAEYNMVKLRVHKEELSAKHPFQEIAAGLIFLRGMGIYYFQMGGYDNGKSALTSEIEAFTIIKDIKVSVDYDRMNTRLM